jgi:hypothetical protein
MLSNFSSQELRVVRTEADWAKVWDNLGGGEPGASSPPPTIDFKREVVLLAAMGEQPNEGYRLTIQRAYRSKRSLVVELREIVPSPGCDPNPGPTQPVDIARIETAGEAIRFVVQRVEACTSDSQRAGPGELPTPAKQPQRVYKNTRGE